MADPLFQNPHEEARARIIWGESPAEVRQWLMREGLTDEQVDVLIRDIRKERAAEIRRSGLRRIRFGLLLSLVSFGIIALIEVTGGIGSLDIPILLAAVCLFVIGLYQLISGILRLFSGRASGSVTELD